MEPWLSLGLLLAGGKCWIRNPKLLTAVREFESLKSYPHAYNQCVGVLVRKAALKGSRLILVNKDICGLTFNVLLKCSFSYVH